VIVRRSIVTASVSERSCTIPKPAAVFQPTQRQAFLWFVARQVRAGDQLRVDWIDPSGAISTTAEYGELPTTPELCFTTQLPIAGFAPASQSGLWTVRVVSNGKSLFSREFQIGLALPGAPQLSS